MAALRVPLILPFAFCIFHFALPAPGRADEPFFSSAAPPSTAALPADGFYPHGRRMAYMGYSGKPERDLANGFTVAGPAYGDDRPYVRDCAAHNWPVVAHISHGPRFTDKDPAKNYTLDEPQLRENVAAEVRALAPLKQIIWWAVAPEELRCWRKTEMRYLEIVCETIRANDPLQRPLYIYNPNNRTKDSLLPIAKQIDIVGKGCYVNLSGKKRDRAWVGWSIQQEVEAVRAAGRPHAIPIVMPELCRDPEPGEEQEIRAWVRHDIYLGLVKGAKGVCLWSLFKRREVSKTWQLWYDAYAECGRELNGERGLAQVFLFGGEPKAKLDVKLVKGAALAAVKLGGEAGNEAATTTEEERQRRDAQLPSWAACERVYGGAHWLFLVNSANGPATFEAAGWPPGTQAADGFDCRPVALAKSLRWELPAYGVTAIRFAPAKKGGAH